jgi:hypothetical protein
MLFQQTYLALATGKACAPRVEAMGMCGLLMKKAKKKDVKNVTVPEKTGDIPVVVVKVLDGPMHTQIRQHQEKDDLNSEQGNRKISYTKEICCKPDRATMLIVLSSCLSRSVFLMQ